MFQPACLLLFIVPHVVPCVFQVHSRPEDGVAVHALRCFTCLKSMWCIARCSECHDISKRVQIPPAEMQIKLPYRWTSLDEKWCFLSWTAWQKGKVWPGSICKSAQRGVYLCWKPSTQKTFILSSFHFICNDLDSCLSDFSHFLPCSVSKDGREKGAASSSSSW